MGGRRSGKRKSDENNGLVDSSQADGLIRWMTFLHISAKDLLKDFGSKSVKTIRVNLKLRNMGDAELNHPGGSVCPMS